jgi:TonB family protein
MCAETVRYWSNRHGVGLVGFLSARIALAVCLLCGVWVGTSSAEVVLFQTDSSEYPIIARAWIVGDDGVLWDVSGEKDPALPSELDMVAVETFPEIVELAKPKYPDKAKELGIEGAVTVMALIDSSGQVVKVRVAKAPDPDHGMSEAAAEAVKAGKFKAATSDGKPVACWISLSMEFSLGDKENSGVVKPE